MERKGWRKTSAGGDVPWIIYGTAWKKERTAELVVQAVTAGFRGIDTACQPRHYDEALVGAALARLQKIGIGRESLYLQTKYTPLGGHDPAAVPYDRHAPVARQVAESFATSLKNLQTSYLDTLILHSPLATHAQTMEAWEAMESIQKAGGALQLGISNCHDLKLMEKLYAEAEVKPAILQNRFYQDTGYDILLRRWCDGHNVIYQSFWTLTANPHKLQDRVVETIAGNHGRTVEQVFFRFLNQSGVVPLTGTCSEQHMEEDLSILDFRLEEAEMDNMRMLLGGAGQ